MFDDFRLLLQARFPERLQSTVAAESGRVTISVGCASLAPPAVQDSADLVREADRLLYEAKRTGRNKVLSPNSADMLRKLPVASDEQERLEAVEIYLHKAADGKGADLDLIARSAAQLMGAPIGFVSLVGKEELTLVGRHGIDIEKVPREIAFCSHTIMGEEPLVVNDTLSEESAGAGRGGLTLLCWSPPRRSTYRRDRGRRLCR
jgi:hypothetical protein